MVTLASTMLIFAILALLLAVALTWPFIEAHIEGNMVYWDGYIVASNFSNASPIVTSVNGSWRVGSIEPNFLGKLLPTVWDSHVWVGVGGYRGDINIVQIGTASTFIHNLSTSTTRYFAWYELFNSTNPPITISNFSVFPNDTIYASVKCISNCSQDRQLWQLTLKDLTRNESFNKVVPFASTRKYGEWIVELRPDDLASDFYVTRSPTYFGEGYTKIDNTDYATVGSTTGTINSLTHQMSKINSTIEHVSNLTFNGTSFYVR